MYLGPDVHRRRTQLAPVDEDGHELFNPSAKLTMPGLVLRQLPLVLSSRLSGRWHSPSGRGDGKTTAAASVGASARDDQLVQAAAVNKKEVAAAAPASAWKVPAELRGT